MRVALLGPVSATLDGRELDLGPPRQRELFAALAANANNVVSRPSLVDAVWGMDAPVTVASSIYTYVARLRRALEPRRPPRGPSDHLSYDGFGYMLTIDSARIDAQRFQEHAARLHKLRSEGSLEEAVEEADAALALWRGRPFDGAVGPLAEAERTRLTELWLTATEDRAEALLDLGRKPDVGQLFALVRQHSLRERLRSTLMRSYWQMGRRADALAEFRDLRFALSRDLGIEPGAEVQQLHEQILRGRPVTRRDGVVWKTDRWARAAITRAHQPPNLPGFTGRQAELDGLHRLVDSTDRSGEAGVILINGGPAVGKTTLAMRFAHELADRFPDGRLHVTLGGTSVPAAPSEALDQMLACLDATFDAGLEPEQKIAHYRSLIAGRRLLMVFDDAFCAEQIRPLLPGTSSCLVLVTSRNRLSGLVARDGARRVVIDGISAHDAVTLLTRVAGRPVSASDATRDLVRACDGHPLALRLAAENILDQPWGEASIAPLVADGSTLLDRLDVEGDPQSSLRALFAASYRALPPGTARMFRALGRLAPGEFDVGMAAQVAGVGPQQAYGPLHSLVDAHLVRRGDCPRHFRMPLLLHAYAHGLSAADQPAVMTRSH